MIIIRFFIFYYYIINKTYEYLLLNNSLQRKKKINNIKIVKNHKILIFIIYLINLSFNILMECFFMDL